MVEKRVWRVSTEHGTHVVELNYGRWTGRGALTVNGQTLARLAPTYLDLLADHHFRLGDRDAVLQPAMDGFAFDYDLLVEGRSVDTGLPSPLARRLRWRNYIAVVQLLTGMAIVIVAIASWLALVELRYEGSGQIANGTVVGRREEHGDSGTSSYVGYRFSVPDGRVVGGESEVGPVTYGQLEVGAPVSVQHITDDPAWSRLHGQSGWELAQWLGAVAAVAGATSLFVLARRVSRERIERRLAAEGLSASAVVTAIDRLRLPMAHGAIRYSYPDQDGRERQGKSWTLRPDELTEWRVGDRCRVRYDHKDPAVSLFVERLSRES